MPCSRNNRIRTTHSRPRRRRAGIESQSHRTVRIAIQGRKRLGPKNRRMLAGSITSNHLNLGQSNRCTIQRLHPLGVLERDHLKFRGGGSHMHGTGCRYRTVCSRDFGDSDCHTRHKARFGDRRKLLRIRRPDHLVGRIRRSRRCGELQGFAHGQIFFRTIEHNGCRRDAGIAVLIRAGGQSEGHKHKKQEFFHLSFDLSMFVKQKNPPREPPGIEPFFTPIPVFQPRNTKTCDAPFTAETPRKKDSSSSGSCKAGLLARPCRNAFPALADQWLKHVAASLGTYSSGNCCRFSRHSHLITQGLARPFVNHCGANLGNKFVSLPPQT